MADIQDKLRLQFEGLPTVPKGYPQGHPVVGDWQLPVMKQVTLSKNPLAAVGFDDRKKSVNHRDTLIHFYRDDLKFNGVLARPKTWVSRLMDFGYIVTPDISLGDDMPWWVMAHRVFYSRAVGVIWQLRGMTVIPNIRWRYLNQIPQITQGIPVGSTIAVSNYGFRRNPVEKQLFADGLLLVLDILNPTTVILFGSINGELEYILRDIPNVVVLEKRVLSNSNLQAEGLSSTLCQDTLF
jgi:hypothetical protein